MPFPSPGDLPDPGIEPRSHALQVLISFLFSFAFHSLLFTAICKDSPDSHFASLHFFSFGIKLLKIIFMNPKDAQISTIALPHVANIFPRFLVYNIVNF